ncbi:MAG: hypothetical protein AB3N13_13115 [Arenibacterium sp.]
MATITAYDRQSIMQEAWANTWDFLARNPHGRRASAFARYLSEAWTKEKSRLHNARRAEALAAMSIDAMTAQIDRAQYGTPRPGDFPLVQLLEARNAKRAEADNAAKRDLIQQADACTVTFTKANGQRRVMRVQARKVAEHVKGDSAKRSGRIAAHTRAFRHPNLLPVWDAEARAIKSVNLSTVSVIETADATHTF